jgi:hypothetical protein
MTSNDKRVNGSMAKKKNLTPSNSFDRLKTMGETLLSRLEKRIISCGNLTEAPLALNDVAIEQMFGRKLSVVEIYIELAEIIMKLDKGNPDESKETMIGLAEIPLTNHDKLLADEFLRRQREIENRKTSADF